eukprot:3255459-Prymnesium_polylepis.1
MVLSGAGRGAGRSAGAPYGSSARALDAWVRGRMAAVLEHRLEEDDDPADEEGHREAKVVVRDASDHGAAPARAGGGRGNRSRARQVRGHVRREGTCGARARAARGH